MLFGGASQTAAHEPVLLDPNRATPGIRLELIEVPSSEAVGAQVLGYRIAATGLPTGLVVNVWTKPFGHGFHEVASAFQVEETGRLVSAQNVKDAGLRYLDQIVLRPAPEAYPRGATWQVAVASDDRTVTSFAKVIPRPIIGRDGPCTVWLELVSHRGDRFLVSGSGFAPGDDVTVESRYSGRIRKKPQRVSATGLLPAELISHAAMGDDRSAFYSVKGRTCEVTLAYWWGEPALRGR
jgi:hypothetical protein